MYLGRKSNVIIQIIENKYYNTTLSALIRMTSISAIKSTRYYKGHSLQEVIKITILYKYVYLIEVNAIVSE